MHRAILKAAYPRKDEGPRIKHVVRWIIGILLTVGIVAGLTFTTLQSNQIECNACVKFGGNEVFCAKAAATNEEEARSTAIYTACASVTSGVTEVIACKNKRPVSMHCETP